MNLKFTDIAMEAKNILYKDNNIDNSNKITEESFVIDDVTITNIEIKDESIAEKLKKNKGRYITIQSNIINETSLYAVKKISIILKDVLRKMLSSFNLNSVLICGLGNSEITPDALGPYVVNNIMITKHLKEIFNDNEYSNLKKVSAIIPGVLGKTGIETKNIIKGIISEEKISLCIIIDALCAGSLEHLNKTIQITDTGINPGSGVGNKRALLNKKTIGVPVIVIGVPTVISSADIFKEKGNEKYKDFIVAPKDTDFTIKHLAKIIGYGINLSLHSGIDIDYINNFIY